MRNGAALFGCWVVCLVTDENIRLARFFAEFVDRSASKAFFFYYQLVCAYVLQNIVFINCVSVAWTGKKLVHAQPFPFLLTHARLFAVEQIAAPSLNRHAFLCNLIDLACSLAVKPKRVWAKAEHF